MGQRGAGIADPQYIRSGKPNQNAYIECFNRRLREDILDAHLFATLDSVRGAAHWWMIEYDEGRPYDALGDLNAHGVRGQSVHDLYFQIVRLMGKLTHYVGGAVIRASTIICPLGCGYPAAQSRNAKPFLPAIFSKNENG